MLNILSFLDLGTAINTAQLFGLLIPIHGVGEIRSIVSCDENIAQEIISGSDKEMVDKMTDLFNTMQNVQGPKLVKNNLRN